MASQEELLATIQRLERRVESLEVQEPTGFMSYIGAKYCRGTAQTFNDNTWTIVDYNTKIYDTHDCVTTGSSWKFTAPVSGYYEVAATLLMGLTAAWAEHEPTMMALNVNGVGTGFLMRGNGEDFSSSAEYKWTGGSSTVYMQAGDYAQVLFLQWSGFNTNCHNDTAWNQVEIHRHGSVTSLNEPVNVACRWVQSYGQSFPTITHTQVDFDTKVYDTHDAGNASTYGYFFYTVPVSGYYQISMSVMFQATTVWGEREIIQMGWRHDHTAAGPSVIIDRSNGRDFSSGNEYHYSHGSTGYYWTAGQIIVPIVYQGSGSTLNLHTSAAFNVITIHRMGSINSKTALTSDLDIGGHWARATDQSIPTATDTVVKLDTEVYNNGLHWDGAAATYSDRTYILKSGMYYIDCFAYWRNTSTAGNYREWSIKRWDAQAGVTRVLTSQRIAPSVSNIRVPLVHVAGLRAGDWIWEQCKHDAGVSIAVQTRRTVQIVSPTLVGTTAY